MVRSIPVLHITRDNLLNWYFESDDEQIDFAIYARSILRNAGTFSINVQEILEDSLQENIPVNLLEEYKDLNTDQTIGGMFDEWDLRLVQE